MRDVVNIVGVMRTGNTITERIFGVARRVRKNASQTSLERIKRELVESLKFYLSDARGIYHFDESKVILLHKKAGESLDPEWKKSTMLYAKIAVEYLEELKFAR